MSTIKQLVAERRTREDIPSLGSTAHSGVCTGVYEIGNDKRVVARVRLATDVEVTAYVPRHVVAPAVGATVQLRDEHGADHPPVRHGLAIDGPAVRQSVVADQQPPRYFVADQQPPRYFIADQPPARSIVADR